MSVTASNKGNETAKSLIETLKSNGTKYDNLQESRGLIAVHDQQLFVWHSLESCVLSVELSNGNVIDTKNFNILLPTNPPVFDIEYITFNGSGTFLALVGRRGVMIMQIPWVRKPNWGNSLFCRSSYVAEKFFVCSSRVKVLQASWHPGSASYTHLVVLGSDNYLRMYDSSNSQTPLQAVNLNSSDSLSAKVKVSFSACFEESAVSFAFGPPEPNDTESKSLSSSKSNDLVWPIYVLYSNGDIYLVKMSIHKSKSALLEGPLAMHPPAEDNYGIDACSLICLHSNPPVLVVAMMSGLIYHCLILDTEEEEEESRFLDQWLLNSSLNDEPKVSLYVHGSVELPMVLSEELNDFYSQPVRLYKDVMSQNKYHCSLSCGVYTIVVPFIQKLEKCVEKGDIENVLSDMQHNDCIVEHLLSTQPLSTVKPVPIIGIASAVFDAGLSLICFLSSWEFTVLPLLSSSQSLTTPLRSSSSLSENETEDKSSTENFGQQIKRLLSRSINTPILKTNALANDKEVASSQQHLELLWSITNRFREEYIDRLCSAHSLIEHRAIVLRQHKELQLQVLERHLTEKEQLYSKAQELTEKYQRAYLNQQLLLERTEKVMKLLQHRFPILSTAEIQMKHELLATEEKVKGFETSLQKIKEKISQQNKISKDLKKDREIENLESSMQKISLSETQLSHLREILQQESNSIAKLVKNVVSLKREHGI